jgi:hypothetical protein
MPCLRAISATGIPRFLSANIVVRKAINSLPFLRGFLRGFVVDEANLARFFGTVALARIFQ